MDYLYPVIRVVFFTLLLTAIAAVSTVGLARYRKIQLPTVSLVFCSGSCPNRQQVISVYYFVPDPRLCQALDDQAFYDATTEVFVGCGPRPVDAPTKVLL